MRIYSFGYKLNGKDQFATTGPNAPLIIDARVLSNPHSDPALRRMTGRDKPVQDMILASPTGREMLTQAVNYLLGDPTRSVAFGCAYGKHRSVALAELTAQRLQDYSEQPFVIHTGAAK